jgi:hypothetical protein
MGHRLLTVTFWPVSTLLRGSAGVHDGSYFPGAAAGPAYGLFFFSLAAQLFAHKDLLCRVMPPGRLRPDDAICDMEAA